MDSTVFDFDYSEKKTFYFALFSDIHLDADDHDRKRFIHDMNQAVSMGARIHINGDLFEAILHTDRKRYARSRDDSGEDASINKIIFSNAAILKPYVNHIDFISLGNHEVSVIKYSAADLIQLLVWELQRHRDPALPPIKRGDTKGFITLNFRHGANRKTRRYVIYRDHGKGGNSPVTKGTIMLERAYTTYLADMYWMGHTHTSLIDTTRNTIYVNGDGNIVRKKKRGIITAGYKKVVEQNSYDDPESLYRMNYNEEKFVTPNAEGYGLLRLDLVGNGISSRIVNY